MHFEFAPIDFRAELNDEQYAAVTAEPGPNLVLAGAGSGKTRTLTYRVAYLLHKGVQPGEILLLTFTNKAAGEMLERVEDLTHISRRQLWGGTFHSIAQRILRVHGEKIGLKRHFTILDESEAETILKNAIQKVDPKFIKTKHYPKPKYLSNRISYARNTRTTVCALAEEEFPFLEGLADKIAEIYDTYQKMKLEQQVTDYDDLLEHFLQLLQEHPDVAAIYQERFRHILVDEFQDTNRLQSEIVDAIAVHHQVMAVGDDAQCIYTWRGADFENIMRFNERHPETTVHKIETNYRSSPQILSFANAVLGNQPAGKGYFKELRPVRPDGEKPYFVPVMDTRAQASFILQRISALVDAGRKLSDIAILYRAHYHAMELQMELSRHNIDYQITSGVRFFEQAHVKDFSAQLRFASNPADLAAFTRFTTLLPKIGPKSAERIHKFARQLAEKNQKNFCDVLGEPEVLKKVPADSREEWPSLAETLREIARALTDSPPEEVVQLALDGWYLNLEDELLFVGDEGTTESVGETNRLGVEFAATLWPLEWWYLRGDVAYTSVRLDDGNAPLAQAPRFVTKAATGIRWEGFATELNLRHLGERYGTDGPGPTLSDYTVLDFAARYRTGPIEVGFAIENLTDTHWRSSEFYYESQPTPDPNSAAEDFHFSPGNPRNVRAWLTAYF